MIIFIIIFAFLNVLNEILTFKTSDSLFSFYDRMKKHEEQKTLVVQQKGQKQPAEKESAEPKTDQKETNGELIKNQNEIKSEETNIQKYLFFWNSN